MTRRGIETNREQIRAIKRILSPRTKKEIQRITRQLPALYCFISIYSDKCQPFFNANKDVERWGDEYAATFQNIKDYLQQPSILMSPKTDHIIGIYLVASNIYMSFVIVKNKKTNLLPK